jgi:predicted Zn-dependent protease
MKIFRKAIFKRIASLIMVFILVSAFFCIKAEASSPTDYAYSYKLQSGSVANLTYYIDTTANQALFASAINNAIAQWVNATAQNSTYAKVGFTRVYSATGATIVFKAQGTFPSWVSSGVNGYTELYSGNNLVTYQANPPTSNWTNCIVYLKTTMSPTTSTAQRTACHEIGHCLGLAHPTPPSGVTFTSIMYPSGSSIYAADSPTSTDAGQIEKIY